MKNRKGFTLIELVMVIIILGILAAVAIPTFINYQTQAQDAAEKGVVGGVRAGIMTSYLGNNYTYPATLDSASDGTCTTANACFTNVLTQGGITEDWSKSGTVYTGPDGGAYGYNSSTGSFM